MSAGSVPQNFTQALAATRAALEKVGSAKADVTLINDLIRLAAADGPHPAFAGGLEQLRWQLARGTEDECSILLQLCDQSSISEVAGVEGVTADRVAALKFLRHFYLGNLRGGQQVWIVSLPRAYVGWPHQEFRLGAPSLAVLRGKANDVAERFSHDDRRNLETSAQDALKWTMDALIKLGPVASDTAGPQDIGTMLIRRWFCDEASSERELWRFAQILSAGFQKMAAVANSSRLVFTDHPGFRNSELERSEAFVHLGPDGDRLDVIYIEGAFFGQHNVLTGRRNWARIVVHELSHREANTVDVKRRYGWQGIRPKSSTFPASQAITNADSWAYFAADCADALTEDDRARLLR